MTLDVRTLLVTLGLIAAALFFVGIVAVSMLILVTPTVTIVSLTFDLTGMGQPAARARPGAKPKG